MRYTAGLFLGAWFVANIVVYRLLVRAGWPFGADAPAGIRVDIFDSHPSSVTVLTLTLAFILPVALVLIWKHVERASGVDQEIVVSVWRWCVRALTNPASIAVVTGVLILLLLPAFREIFWVTAIPAIAFVALLPFGVFNPRVAASPDGHGWWRLQWPGVKPAVGVLMLFIAVVAVELAATAIAETLPTFAPVVFLVEAVLAMAAIAVEGAILLFRATPLDIARGIRDFLSWQRLGPIIAVNVRLMFLLAFIAAPVIVGAVLLWQIVPLHAVWAESHSAVLPWSARMLVLVAAALETSGVIATSFIAGLAVCLMVARILWLTASVADCARGASSAHGTAGEM